jgi:hypothetical protein
VLAVFADGIVNSSQDLVSSFQVYILSSVGIGVGGVHVNVVVFNVQLAYGFGG